MRNAVSLRRVAFSHASDLTPPSIRLCIPDGAADDLIKICSIADLRYSCTEIRFGCLLAGGRAWGRRLTVVLRSSSEVRSRTPRGRMEVSLSYHGVIMHKVKEVVLWESYHKKKWIIVSRSYHTKKWSWGFLFYLRYFDTKENPRSRDMEVDESLPDGWSVIVYKRGRANEYFYTATTSRTKTCA